MPESHFVELPNLDLKNSESLYGITNPNYGSRQSSLEDFPFNMSLTPPNEAHRGSMGTTGRKQGMKKASLFTWMTLQSVPEETIISPHILEFLEQTLEPIPTKTNFSSTGK